MDINTKIAQLQAELALLTAIQNNANQPFDWTTAPLICILDGFEYYLGPESATDMTLTDAETWATSVGGIIPTRVVLLKMLDFSSSIAANQLWSSTALDDKSVWVQNMNTMTQNAYNKNSLYGARAVKAVVH